MSQMQLIYGLLVGHVRIWDFRGRVVSTLASHLWETTRVMRAVTQGGTLWDSPSLSGGFLPPDEPDAA